MGLYTWGTNLQADGAHIPAHMNQRDKLHADVRHTTALRRGCMSQCQAEFAKLGFRAVPGPKEHSYWMDLRVAAYVAYGGLCDALDEAR